jgi:thiol-disulfide isomerase/thioredoxin
MSSINKLFILALVSCLIPAGFSESLLPSEANASRDKVVMYFFWQTGCPHCEELKPFMASLEEKYPQLDLKRIEVSQNKEGSDLFIEMSKAYGREPKVTPTEFVGDYMIEGYNGWITEGRIEGALLNCTQKKCPTPEEKIREYLKGQISTTTIPATTTSTTTTTSTARASTTISTSTTSTTASTVSSTTLVTSTTLAAPDTTIPAAEKSIDTSLLAGAILVIFLILAGFVQMSRARGKDKI